MISKRSLRFCLFFALCPSSIWAIGDHSYVTHTSAKHCFALSEPGSNATLLVSSKDNPGVIRALYDLKADIIRVTGNGPTIAIGSTAIPKGSCDCRNDGQEPFYRSTGA